jgi:hypothetical protein
MSGRIKEKRPAAIRDPDHECWVALVPRDDGAFRVNDSRPRAGESNKQQSGR